MTKHIFHPYKSYSCADWMIGLLSESPKGCSQQLGDAKRLRIPLTPQFSSDTTEEERPWRSASPSGPPGPFPR